MTFSHLPTSDMFLKFANIFSKPYCSLLYSVFGPHKSWSATQGKCNSQDMSVVGRKISWFPLW